jgi:alpha,alpha-trehalase
MEGLIESGLFDIVNATLQNFMDELEQFGFIPNGGRIYCTFNVSVVSAHTHVLVDLNRSQPPVFIQVNSPLPLS